MRFVAILLEYFSASVAVSCFVSFYFVLLFFFICIHFSFSPIGSLGFFESILGLFNVLKRFVETSKLFSRDCGNAPRFFDAAQELFF